MSVTEKDSSVLVATPDFARRRLRARLLRARPLLIGLLVVVVLVASGWLLYFSSVVTVESVEVSGNSAALSSSSVEKVAEVPFGEQLIKVDLDAIKARVERMDSVVSAEVSRSWPHAISIRIFERVPIAVLRTDGHEKALGADGKAFVRKKSLLPPDLPVIETALNVNEATLSEAARVVLSLPAGVASRVDLIKAESIDNIVLKLSGGVTVVWGSASDSEVKGAVLGTLLGQDVTEIDVSVPARPTTR